MSINIRPIQEADNLELATLIRKVFREFKIDRPGTVYTDPTTDDLYNLFRQPNSAYFVAEENGEIVGGCGIYPTDGLPKGCAELVKFYLSAEARGRGIGNQLMQQSIEEAKKLGYKQLYLESFPELAKAVSMYEKAGFKPLPHAMGNSGHYACNIWMLKEL
ncbi:GNAT family N-acetyltransferase [Pontibacter cellulosilyticus]|uniref:GNAT family N-acetyltransferase n=1 Tax=Pontibacter cellulosilyticus TaxID=1720253 RepID=A0A923SJ30_9BACT|nr:GNAT family N-acetyltransferase [Pontibacter cellulosilyticus]MBC5993232.1 GNAT family N-acetyltransferase [Pontibacter cellulosilyticus]